MYLKTSLRDSLLLTADLQHLVSVLAPTTADVWSGVSSSLLTPFLLLLNVETEKGSITQQNLCSACLLWTSLWASCTLATNQWGGNSFFVIRQFVAAFYQTSGRNVCSGFSKYYNQTYSVRPVYFELQLDLFMELFCFQSFPSPKWLKRGVFYFPFYCFYF